MNTHDRVRRIRMIGSAIGVISFMMIMFFAQPINVLKFVVAFVIFLTFLILSIYHGNKSLLDYINKADNPRKTFWELFLKGDLDTINFKRIPKLIKTIESFQDEYFFYDKNSTGKYKFAINRLYFSYKNINGQFKTRNINLVKSIKVNPDRIISTEGSDKLFVRLTIKLKNGESDSTDITKIDYPIDEIEQILEHFVYGVTKKHK